MNYKFENLYKDVKELELEVQVVSNKTEKEYYNRYKVKVLTQKYKNTYIYITTKNELK